jgi:hypothetical protein
VEDVEMMFSLRFALHEISHWASRYPVESDADIELVIAPKVCSRGYFTRQEFLAMCHWKTPRSRSLVESNPAEFIESVTGMATTTGNERLRIEVLTLLRGVRWPTASVLLHFGHPEPYPILDFRALWSLGVEEPPVYEFSFWWEYTRFCRSLAEDAGVSMRTLDRALWAYSKKNQGK